MKSPLVVVCIGATVEIVNDLTALSDYVDVHREPGPGPLLDLEKATLLEMWDTLGSEGTFVRPVLNHDMVAIYTLMMLTTVASQSRDF